MKFFSLLFALFFSVVIAPITYAGGAPAAEFYYDPLIPPSNFNDEVLSTYESSGNFTPAFHITDGSSRDNLSGSNPAATPDVGMFHAYDGIQSFLGYGEERSTSSNGYDLFVKKIPAVDDPVLWTSPQLAGRGNDGGAEPNGFSQILEMVPDDNGGVYVLFEEGEDGPGPTLFGNVVLVHLDGGTGNISWIETLDWRNAVITSDGDGGIYLLRDSGNFFDGTASTSVGFLERYDDTGLVFGPVQVSDKPLSQKGGAEIVTYDVGGAPFDVVVMWMDDDNGGADAGLYARRFDSTGSPANANWNDSEGTLIARDPNLDPQYFSSDPGLYYIQADSNLLYTEDNIMGAAILDGELSVFAFDGDANNLFPCGYNQVTSDFDQFDILAQVGASGGDRGAYLVWQDDEDLMISLIAIFNDDIDNGFYNAGESYWNADGVQVFSHADLEVTLKFPPFQTNARAAYKGSSFSQDFSSNEVILVYGEGTASAFTDEYIDEGFAPDMPGGDCVAAITTPDAPVLDPAVAGDGEVDLSWSIPADNGDPLTDYTIQYRELPAGGFVTFPDGGPALITSITVTGLTNDQAYEFRVAAENGGGLGSYSNTVQATPTSPGGGRRRSVPLNQAPWVYLGSLRTAAQQGNIKNAAEEQFMSQTELSEYSEQLFEQINNEPGGSLERSFSEDPFLQSQLGEEGQNLLSVLDLIVALRRLFGWMQADDYQLMNEYEPLSKEYYNVFLTRAFHRTVGVEYVARQGRRSYRFNYREPMNDPTELVVDYQKSIMLTFGKLCYSEETLRYAQEIDYPGNGDWYQRYQEYMDPWLDEVLGSKTYVPWLQTAGNVEDVLKSMYLYLFGFCLGEQVLE